MTDLAAKIQKAARKIILLDYDGTLVAYTPAPLNAYPSPRVLNIIQKLVKSPGITVVIVTGRKYNEVDAFLAGNHITIIAEHGAIVKENGRWQKMIPGNAVWKNEALLAMNKIVPSCAGSFVEQKYYSVAWHYRLADHETGYACARQLLQLLEPLRDNYDLKVIHGNKIVEVMSRLVNKGKAVMPFVMKHNYDCILCIGDDVTDEDMFMYLKDYANAVTVKVGKGPTAAAYRLDGIDNVIALLESLV